MPKPSKPASKPSHKAQGKSAQFPARSGRPDGKSRDGEGSKFSARGGRPDGRSRDGEGTKFSARGGRPDGRSRDDSKKTFGPKAHGYKAHGSKNDGRPDGKSRDGEGSKFSTRGEGSNFSARAGRLDGRSRDGEGSKFSPRGRKADGNSHDDAKHDGDKKPFSPKANRFKAKGGGKPFGADKPYGKSYNKPYKAQSKPKPEPAQTPVTIQPIVTPRHGRGQLLHGLHAVREAWLNPARQCHQLWLTSAAEIEFAPTLAAAVVAGLNRPAPQRTERTMLDAMLPGAIHQGIALDAAPLPDVDLAGLIARQPKLLIVLDQVTDPHNVGAILRSAAAFGAQGVVLTERHAPGMTGTLAKSASGALEHVPLVPVVNLARALEQLREAGFWCIGLAEEGEKPLHGHDLSGATALVLGAEGDGLRRLTRERCDALAHLPTQGAIGSLNVSNAAAVALYEARQQQATASAPAS